MNIDRSRANVLIITDDEETGQELADRVAEAGEEPHVAVGAGRGSLGRGDGGQIDLVLTDLSMDSGSARNLLERLCTGDLFFGVPQIHLLPDDDARRGLQELTTDVASITMPRPADAEGFQAHVRLAAEIGRLRREIACVTIRDRMTGCYNRPFLVMRIEQEFSRARRYNSPISLSLFEIDGLRSINERYGVSAGDQAIQHLARAVDANVRHEDVQGRWGEKSFAVLLPGTSQEGASVLANRIRHEVDTLDVETGMLTFGIHLSVGVSDYIAGEMETHMDLIRTAEYALDEASRAGGNQVLTDKTALPN